MTAQSKIVEINRSTGDLELTETLDQANSLDNTLEQDGFESSSVEENYWPDEDVAVRNWGKIALASLLIGAATGWTAFFIWANMAEILAIPNPSRVSELIIQWSAPIAVIALLWLLAMRSSTAEARRFADVSLSLRTESLALEERMRVVNGEIALARSFLAENAKELDSVGRLSAQRLTEAAEKLTLALNESDERAKMLQVASNAAVSNLEQLRNHLPVVTSAAKDATNQIGIAGNTANTQIHAIIGTLGAMEESAANVGNSLKQLDEQIASSESRIVGALNESGAAFTSSVEHSDSIGAALIASLSSSIADTETRIEKMAEMLDSRIGSSHQRLEANLTSLGEAIAHLEAVTDAQDSNSKAVLERVRNSIAECRQELGTFGDDATDKIAKLAFAVSALGESSGGLSSQLASTNVQTDALIGKAAKMEKGLSEISGNVTSQLSGQLDLIIDRFAKVQEHFEAVSQQLEASDKDASTLINSVATLEQSISAQQRTLDALNAESVEYLSGQQEQVDALSAAISHSRSALEELSGIANEQLVGSLLRVRETAKQAADASRKIVEEELTSVSEKLNENNRITIETAVEQQVQAVDSAMKEAFQRNLNLAAEVEERITRQLQVVDEMASNLELRVSEAHSSFGGIDDEGFARRMALLTESLNSAAIDVAKILSNDVTDTAWAAYLKGDRGVFTRRAVRLLDSGEVKIIAAHYDDDAEFREHVNRYIHDFESMMRVLLSSRDGNAVGVTLLSSDVGKLYVALAQAIDRLRS